MPRGIDGILAYIPVEQGNVMVNSEGISKAACEALERFQATARRGGSVSLMDDLKLKIALKADLGVDEAFMRYRDSLAPGAEVALRRQPVVHQVYEAERRALIFHEVHRGGEPVELLPSPAIGEPCEAQPIRGRARRVFVACLSNATAFARSTTVRLADGTFAFDLQEGELGRLPVNPAFDPVVFDWDGKLMHVVDDRRATTRLHVTEALSLLGSDTMSFGHWMAEELLKFLTARRVPGVASVPILIDAAMPSQHRESIVAFTGDAHPIIEVPRFMRVEAERLWIVSNWGYSPKLLMTDRGVDANALAVPTAALADVYRKAWQELDARLGIAPPNGRVFVARDPARHRAITNHGEVEAILQRHGFEPMRPEGLSFVEQFRRYRSANLIAVQSGSAEVGLLMCAPGTRICLMTHPATPLRALWSQTVRELGIDATLLVGGFDTINPIYADRSSYTIDPELLEDCLTEMSRGDAHA